MINFGTIVLHIVVFGLFFGFGFLLAKALKKIIRDSFVEAAHILEKEEE